MKKVICIVLSIFFIFAFISCDNAEESSDIIVYVSRYGKIHSDPNCSGMIYYKTMTLYTAINEGYVLCKNCSEDLERYNDVIEE